MMKLVGLGLFLAASFALLACETRDQPTVQHQTLGSGGQPYTYDAPASHF